MMQTCCNGVNLHCSWFQLGDLAQVLRPDLPSGLSLRHQVAVPVICPASGVLCLGEMIYVYIDIYIYILGHVKYACSYNSACR